MMQVAGRAGRRDDGGEVVIQTGDPGNPVIRQVAAGDYEGMVRMQLADRQAFFLPAVCASDVADAAPPRPDDAAQRHSGTRNKPAHALRTARAGSDDAPRGPDPGRIPGGSAAEDRERGLVGPGPRTASVRA